MAPFRYAQTCPLARAAEVLGHRWSLLVVRELLLGPQRFSDLRRRLGNVSASVLAARLTDLEGHGVIVQRTLAPPAASRVYELSEHGRALEPVVAMLARWGLRWLLERGESGDHVEPDWLQLAIQIFGRRAPTPAHRYELVVIGESGNDAAVRFAGSETGPQILQDDAAVDLRVRLPYALSLGLMTGMLPADAALASPELTLDGDPALLATLPLHFEFDFDGLSTNPSQQRPAASPGAA